MERITAPEKYCLSIGIQDLKTIQSEIQKYKMAEIRLDLCNLTIEQTAILFSSHDNLIVTFRKHHLYSDLTRENYIKNAIVAGAKWIDLDLEQDSNPFKAEMIQFARNHNVRIIISHHDFEKTPDNDTINKTVKEIQKYKPDLIKLAFFSKSAYDNERVFEIYKQNLPLLAFNMGEKGKITRVKCLSYGAPFTYVRSRSDQTAAGQMTLEEMMQYPQ